MDFYDATLKLYFSSLNMPINVFGNTLGKTENKIDTSFFVQKPYLRTIYKESIVEEDIGTKKSMES